MALSILMTSLIAYKVHDWRVDSLRLDWQKEIVAKLQDQEKRLRAECAVEKAITQEASSEYQAKIADLSKRVATVKRMYNNAKCVQITADPASRHNASSIGGELARQSLEGTRIPAGQLIDFLAEGERYRIQLMSCQGFITKVWKSNK